MKLNAMLLAGAALIAATASPALADPVPGVYSTGVDDSGTTKANGSTETHYTVVSAPEGFSGALQVATSDYGYPIGPWLGDNSTSAWIAPAGTGQLSGPSGYYDYQTTFSLAGFDATTASMSGQWAVDDYGIDILLNGVSTGAFAGGFDYFTPFAISSGFVSGLNTLDFIVYNGGGPTGLRTELSLSAAAVPEPAAWAMMILGMGAIGFAMRRRVRASEVKFDAKIKRISEGAVA